MLVLCAKDAMIKGQHKTIKTHKLVLTLGIHFPLLVKKNMSRRRVQRHPSFSSFLLFFVYYITHSHFGILCFRTNEKSEEHISGGDHLLDKAKTLCMHSWAPKECTVCACARMFMYLCVRACG